MDTFLAVASKREVREYSERPLPDSAVRRILEAGRIAGSSQNRQRRSFLVVEDPRLRQRLADAVYASGNVAGAALVVMIVASRGGGPVAFDVGRAAQNMMLVAWDEGIGSCPNGLSDTDAVSESFGLEDDERPVIVLTFGYPSHPRDANRRSPEEWIDSADRKPFDDVVRRL